MMDRFSPLVCGLALAAGLCGQAIGPDRFSSLERGLHALESSLRTHDAVMLLLEDLERARGDRRAAAFAEYEALRVIDHASGFVDPRTIATSTFPVRPASASLAWLSASIIAPALYATSTIVPAG